MTLNVVLPACGTLAALERTPNLPPFGSLQQSFASALSRHLTTAPAVRRYPELVALGFWLRAANVTRVAAAFARAHEGQIHLPRGLVFHVAPSNVDTIFVYSWFVSLLCGNRNVIRISSKESPQTTVLIEALRELLQQEQWIEIARRTLVVRYGHDEEITRSMCERCDMRVVWGGDDTVRALRRFPLPPHATELAFGNKFSLCVLNARAVLNAEAAVLDKLTQGFYNDAYWFDQMACSSPRMVFWIGSENDVTESSAKFWSAVERELDLHDLEIAAADSVNKEVAVDSLAIEELHVRVDTRDPRLTRAWMDAPRVRSTLHCGAGLFHEGRLERLELLAPHLDRHIQTVTQFGIDANAWTSFLRDCLPLGIDRIVPIGHALDFETVWDGFDLFSSFLRQVSIAASSIS